MIIKELANALGRKEKTFYVESVVTSLKTILITGILQYIFKIRT